ncbi:MAG: radical SAM protein, partial [Myxococcales bacterium]|nr:radical SAM protein [Myxococcales bacterium]
MVQPAPQAARGRLPLVGPARPRREHHAVVGTRCNLGCGYCLRLPPTAVSDAGAAEPGDVLVVGGGEPMLEPELLSRLRALPGPVVLETNGALLHVPSNVRRLAAARVRGVRLFLPGWDDESTDRLARVPGLASLQAAAARNVLDAGLELELCIPLTLELAAELPRWLERVEALRG